MDSKLFETVGARVSRIFPTAHLLANFDSPQNPFLTEKLAMQQQGPWMADYIRRMKPELSQVLVPRTRKKHWRGEPIIMPGREAAFPSAVAGLNDVTICEFDALMIPVGADIRKRRLNSWPMSIART